MGNSKISVHVPWNNVFTYYHWYSTTHYIYSLQYIWLMLLNIHHVLWTRPLLYTVPELYSNEVR